MNKKSLIILNILFLFIFNQSCFSQKEDIHKIYSELLSNYIENGLVNYKDLRNDNRLSEYINILSRTNPDELKTKNEELAFWINAYNAYTLKIICENYPVESINDLHTGGKIIGHILGTTIWDKDFVVINNKNLSLNEIEHEIIRPKFNEPLIHFALVCAAMSCPPLRNEPYTGGKINKQLRDQAIVFLNNPDKNKFEINTRTAYLSKIFDWYEDDFGENDSEVLNYILKYLSEEIKEDILNNLDKWDMEYLEYDWSLNEITD